MQTNLRGKVVAIIAVLLVFLYGIFGIPHGSLKQTLTDRIHLGLDLRGGTHLVLQVHTDEAIAAQSDSDQQRLQLSLKDIAPAATVTKPDAKQPVLVVNNVPADKSKAVDDLITGNTYGDYDVSSQQGGFKLAMKQSAIKALRERTLDTSIETIRGRVDSLGVSEPVIQKYGLGEDQILVELPGVSDIDQVRRIVQSTARLEIHEVLGTQGQAPSYNTKEEADAAAIGQDAVVLQGGNNGDDTKWWVLRRIPIVQGPDFRDARPSKDEAGRDDVSFNLTTAAGDRFYDYTSANIGKYMAIVLDNKVKEVASINGSIRDNGQISGGFTRQAANDLSLMLRTGSLPASITYLEAHSVGPSLGASSIRQGVIAAVVGMLAVMVFMLVYYRGAGINADLALVLNLVILLGFMGFFHATLTLPGIAGVILTIGMGVDSNVLIFERIREEMRAGKNAAASVGNGFNHAWVTILDTHVTTLVSAFILFFVGTGPVKGFAITLAFGLLANLFTAVFVSRVIFDGVLSRKQRGEALSI
ncbi:protein translocase subunit SecD [Terriglobus aquaticus]|uniref:Protein translocase subunit SecD n=1 Tax=Terriglobus aquaticus TaxID=940139 RepID=A0ABW9KPM4_9BACT|nr:protein translocase subunit SecD [Terriglobus aquaticus]